MRTLLYLGLLALAACSAPATAPDPAPSSSSSTGQPDTGSTPPPSAPAAANLTGRWLSDTITLPGLAGETCTGVTQVEFLVTQQGSVLSGWEIDRRCGVPGLPADTVAKDSGAVSSPCVAGSCAASYNMVVADSAIWTEGGNWRLSLSASGDTLTNVTPTSVNHSYMPTLFVRQP